MTTTLVPLAKAGPDYGVGVYRDITEWAVGTPGWLQTFGELFTEGGLLLFVGVMVFQWWRARKGDDRAMAYAMIAPLAVVVVYALSEVIKVWLHEERPCRDIPGARAIAECPATGDYSFPSNHSVIAASAVATLLISWRLIGVLLLPVAVLAALSRVYVGVHYLHDVAAGMLLGLLLAPLVLLALRVPGTHLVTALRRKPSLELVLGASPVLAPPAPQHAPYSATRS
ncbi:phosphatase PAP2 family protein [Streptomyces sp. NPDC048438]|uniref:phosphatase PAP2 family protein n=1 Tax=Streptomyces sp. NPDC048438 TaxID=3365551 RepID=UPI0037195F61